MPLAPAARTCASSRSHVLASSCANPLRAAGDASDESAASTVSQRGRPCSWTTSRSSRVNVAVTFTPVTPCIPATWSAIRAASRNGTFSAMKPPRVLASASRWYARLIASTPADFGSDAAATRDPRDELSCVDDRTHSLLSDPRVTS